MASQENSISSVNETPVAQVATVASLEPVPQIIITEASPLNQVQTSGPVPENVTAPASDVSASSEPISKASAEPTPKALVDASKQTELPCDDGEQEQFSAAIECDACDDRAPEFHEVPIAGSVQNPETVVRIDGTETEESEDDFASVDESCRACGGCRGFYYRMADSLGSAYSIPFWLILLGIPLSAGFMGGKYMDGCPGRSTLPFVLMMLGIGGCIMLLAQICYVIGNTICSEVESCIKPFMANIAYTAAVVSLITLIAETVSFFTLEPDFDSLSLQFCDITFYEYTRWMTYTVWLLIFLIVVIRCPVASIRFSRNNRAHQSPILPPLPGLDA